jgi:hypothetical protein
VLGLNWGSGGPSISVPWPTSNARQWILTPAARPAVEFFDLRVKWM